MHVAAKRYLCTVDPQYLSLLSPPSIQSLALQGGPMSAEEVARFESRPFFQHAVRLRRWDDAAKVVGMPTPNLDHFARHIDLALGQTKSAGDSKREGEAPAEPSI
jgi:gamma-butyrobetaine dioxygenase